MTLTEMVLVIAAVAVMAALAVPAVDALLKGFESEGQTKAMISSALASARASAMKHRRYVGVRFQHSGGPENAEDVYDNPQYMVSIIHDPSLSGSNNNAINFRALEGAQPKRLPATFAVVSHTVSGDGQLIDASTFSVVFSPSGRLVVLPLEVIQSSQYDDIFTDTTTDITDGNALFYDDRGLSSSDYNSVQGFYIYSRSRFKNEGTSYMTELENDNRRYYVNPHLGRLIRQQDQ